MKKILLTGAAIITFALTSNAQLRVGIIAGGSLIDQRIQVTNDHFFAGENFKSFQVAAASSCNSISHNTINTTQSTKTP